MHDLPEPLRHTVFTRADAAAHGVTSRMLQGRRFIRMLPRVYRCAEHDPTHRDWIEAARLSLPGDAALTGITRIQADGLDHGPTWPLRFVVARDLHLDVDGVFLHRTVLMPPRDAVGATTAAAYLSYCVRATFLDAVKVGSWLTRRDDGFDEQVRTLALAQPWRDGADEAVWVLPWLDGRYRSLPETEVSTVLRLVGLRGFEPNRPVELERGVTVIGDLVHELGLFVEYEGAHHQSDRRRYLSDVDRYALLRACGRPYVQVTKERLRQRGMLCGDVYRSLLETGYGGPPPDPSRLWMLASPLRDLVGPRRRRGRDRAVP